MVYKIAKTTRKLLIISQVTVATVLIFININLLKESLLVISDPSVMKVEGLTSVTLTQSDARELSRKEVSVITRDIQRGNIKTTASEPC